MPARSPHRLLALAELLSWAGLVLGLHQLWGHFEAGLLDPALLFNRDSLFLPDVVADLRGGGALADWSVPHSLFLFPDAPLWLLAERFADTPQGAVRAFGTVQVLLAAALLRALLVRAHRPAAGLVAPAALCAVLAFVGHGQLREAVDLLRPSHHFGVVLVALLALRLLGAWFRFPRKSVLLALFALAGLATFSDPFALSCVALPLAAALLVVTLRTRVDRARHLVAAAALTMAGVGGHLLSRLVTAGSDELARADPTSFLEQAAILDRALRALDESAPDLLARLALFLVPLFFVRGVFELRRPTLAPALDVAAALAIAATELGLMLTSNMLHTPLNRFQLVVFAVLLLTLARAAAALARWPRVLGGLSVAVALGCCASLTLRLAGQPRQPLARWVSPDAACLARAAAARGVERGLADVALARPLSVLSGGALRFEQLENGEPRWWLSTRRHVAAPTPPVGVAVVSIFNQPHELQARFGRPDELVTCGALTAWFWAEPHRALVTRRLAALPVHHAVQD